MCPDTNATGATAAARPTRQPGSPTATQRLRVLYVPDSIQWVLGTISNNIVRCNPWIEGTVVSASVLDWLVKVDPTLFDRVDLVHFLCPYASARWIPVLRNRMPCVTSHHHVTNWESIKHNLDGDAIIAGSSEWVQDLRDRGARMDRVFRVPYGVDAQRFVPPSPDDRAAIRRGLKIGDDAVVVGFFAKKSSNDDDRKGTDVFAAALRDLHERQERVVAIIVGPGWHEMVDAFRNAGIRCLWFPFIKDNDHLVPMYQALDVYWVTARVEGGPVPLLEAMSVGICCVTTPVGLARELCRDGENAIVVPFNSPDMVVQRTLDVLSEPEVRLGIGASARDSILQSMHIGVTLTRVRDAYVKAFQVFGERSTAAIEMPVAEIAARLDLTRGPPGVSRAAVLPGLRAAAEQREALAWAETLIGSGHWMHAITRLARAVARNPFSPEPWRVLLRNALPQHLVRIVMRLMASARRRKTERDASR